MSNRNDRLSPLERRTAYSLAVIYSLRMLGLFMVLPVFMLYAEHLQGATAALSGLAIGVYGATQAVLQIPYGLLSDRCGRKRLIIIGLVVFALGSVVAALSETIYGVIAGRALQGAGAVAAVVMALAADLTREEQRTKVMASIGVSIGLSFAVALVLGPILNSVIGVSGIFWTTAVLALGGIFVVLYVVPDPEMTSVHRGAEPVPSQFADLLRNTQLLRLDLGILILHLVLTASFVVLPFALRDFAGLSVDKHWQMYLPVLVVSVAMMIPFMLYAERYHAVKAVFLGAILVVGLGQFGLAIFHDSVAGIFGTLLVFFAGFNLLEAMLPSLISRMAPPDAKGTAMGFYSSAQFLGTFLGGVLGGWLYGLFGVKAVFIGCGSIALVWALVAISMRSPRYLSSYTVSLDGLGPVERSELERGLAGVAGVAEAVVVPDERAAYLKIDRKIFDKATLHRFLESQSL